MTLNEKLGKLSYEMEQLRAIMRMQDGQYKKLQSEIARVCNEITQSNADTKIEEPATTEPTEQE